MVLGALTPSLRLHSGDTLLLDTDGLTEVRTGARDRDDEEDLLAFLGTIAPTTAPDAVAAVRTLLTGFGEGLDDDTAVLAVSVARTPPGGEECGDD